MFSIENAARQLFDDWNAKRSYAPLTSDHRPSSVSDAYAVQAALNNLHQNNRGAIAGRKIALSSKAMQDMVGIQAPVGGAIFTNDVYNSPTEVSAKNFIRLGLEFELAFELRADVLPQENPHSEASVVDLIANVRPAFELIEDRAADYTKLDAFTLIADNAWCGGIVLGDVIKEWRNLNLNDTPSCIRQVAQPDEATNTGAANPLSSLAWVLNHFAERGETLSAGEHIITGSVARTRFPVIGDHISYEVAGSRVEMRVV